MRRIRKNRFAAVVFLAGAVVTGSAWPGQAQAQERLARVGILSFLPMTEDSAWWTTWMELFRRNLADQGWIEGKNVSFEYRSANSDPSQFPGAAAELVEIKVDVIWATSAPAIRAAHAATRTIPIVGWDFTTDPIAEGYIQSYARPGGNVTGVFLDAPEFAGKWFELLKATFPDLSRVAVVWDPAPGTTHLQAVHSAAGSLDVELQILEVRKPDDIDKVFSKFRGRPQAVILLPSPMIHGESARLAKLALEHRLPATSMTREFAVAGGALSYGPDFATTIERHAVYVAKILAGSEAAKLPVERPTNVRLVVNLKTARTLGISISESILFRADEVIE